MPLSLYGILSIISIRGLTIHGEIVIVRRVTCGAYPRASSGVFVLEFIGVCIPQNKLQEHCMQRVTFGVASSPFLAVQTLQQSAKDFGEAHPEAQHQIKSHFYVDDLLGGAETETEAVELYQQLTKILSQAGFTSRKFKSNSAAVLDQIPEELRDPSASKELVDVHSPLYAKALGVSWDASKDVMSTDVGKDYNYVATKRGILSDISKTFDVLGWITPVILPMKIMIREMWMREIDWDSPIPAELKAKHEEWREELSQLSAMTFAKVLLLFGAI